MNLVDAVAHAALEGLTTILPLSDSGHRLLARMWLGDARGLESLTKLMDLACLAALVLAVRQRLGAALSEGIRGIAKPRVLQETDGGRDATALVFPSLDEGFGLPILEAMQSGTPVLTSSVSATAEVAGDAALLVDPTDTEQITTAMQRLATDDALCDDLRRRGRERVLRFDPRAQGRAVADHLAAVAGAPDTRD